MVGERHERGVEVLETRWRISGRLILKSDGEWSIKAPKDALGRYHGGIIILEVSACGESQTNG